MSEPCQRQEKGCWHAEKLCQNMPTSEPEKERVSDVPMDTLLVKAMQTYWVPKGASNMVTPLHLGARTVTQRVIVRVF